MNLGVYLDDNLSWLSHISEKSVQLSKIIGVMNKLKNSLPKYILKIIYVSLVHSHLQYGLIVWDGNCGKSNR